MEQNEEKSEFRVSGRLFIRNRQKISIVKLWKNKTHWKFLKKINMVSVTLEEIDWVHLYKVWTSIGCHSYIFLFSRKLQCTFANERYIILANENVKSHEFDKMQKIYNEMNLMIDSIDSILAINQWSYHMIHIIWIICARLFIIDEESHNKLHAFIKSYLNRSVWPLRRSSFNSQVQIDNLS